MPIQAFSCVLTVSNFYTRMGFHAHAHAHTHTHTNIYTYMQTHTYMHTNKHTHTRVHTHRRAHVHTHSHRYACTHARMRACVCTRVYTQRKQHFSFLEHARTLPKIFDHSYGESTCTHAINYTGMYSHGVLNCTSPLF